SKLPPGTRFVRCRSQTLPRGAGLNRMRAGGALTDAGTATREKSLAALIVAHARSQPDEVAFRFLGRRSGQARDLTWGRLADDAIRIAGHLAAFHLAGKPVAILCPDAHEFLPALAACFLVGAVAVPTPPVSSRRSSGRIASIVKSAHAHALVAGRGVMALPWVAGLIEGRGMKILRLEDLGDEPSGVSLGNRHDPSAPALLQFTSGSTGDPVGVLLTNANIAANCDAIAEAYGLDRTTVGLSWLPLHHDMGLIGHVLTPIRLGCRSCIMDPLVFLQRPLSWLQRIGEEKATITSAPNFAYELCNKAAEASEAPPMDLSSLSTAVCGGEPVQWWTLERFAARFQPFGFKWPAFAPSYGLAEATLLVASGKTPSGPKPQGKWTSLGSPVRGVKVRVVEPETGLEVPHGGLGEIEIYGASVGRLIGGTQGEPIAGRVRTGDLGFLAEGSLVVTGRRKELIILKGQNVFPADVEAAAIGASALVVPGGTAAIGCEEEGSEALVVVAEIRRPAASEDTIVRVRRLISEKVALATGHAAREVVTVEFGSLPRTSSGKVQRGIVRELYLAGGLRRLAEARQETAGLP
ncbi:MAG: fatty acyl-AMP ligase, partial [Dongiaceae bacterium]